MMFSRDLFSGLGVHVGHSATKAAAVALAACTGTPANFYANRSDPPADQDVDATAELMRLEPTAAQVWDGDTRVPISSAVRVLVRVGGQDVDPPCGWCVRAWLCSEEGHWYAVGYAADGWVKVDGRMISAYDISRGDHTPVASVLCRDLTAALPASMQLVRAPAAVPVNDAIHQAVNDAVTQAQALSGSPTRSGSLNVHSLTVVINFGNEGQQQQPIPSLSQPDFLSAVKDFYSSTHSDVSGRYCTTIIKIMGPDRSLLVGGKFRDWLAKQYASDKHPVLYIIGATGIGKTTLVSCLCRDQCLPLPTVRVTTSQILQASNREELLFSALPRLHSKYHTYRGPVVWVVDDFRITYETDGNVAYNVKQFMQHPTPPPKTFTTLTLDEDRIVFLARDIPSDGIPPLSPVCRMMPWSSTTAVQFFEHVMGRQEDNKALQWTYLRCVGHEYFGQEVMSPIYCNSVLANLTSHGSNTTADVRLVHNAAEAMLKHHLMHLEGRSFDAATVGGLLVSPRGGWHDPTLSLIFKRWPVCAGHCIATYLQSLDQKSVNIDPVLASMMANNVVPAVRIGIVFWATQLDDEQLMEDVVKTLVDAVTQNYNANHKALPTIDDAQKANMSTDTADTLGISLLVDLEIYLRRQGKLVQALRSNFTVFIRSPRAMYLMLGRAFAEGDAELSCTLERIIEQDEWWKNHAVRVDHAWCTILFHGGSWEPRQGKCNDPQWNMWLMQSSASYILSSLQVSPQHALGDAQHVASCMWYCIRHPDPEYWGIALWYLVRATADVVKELIRMLSSRSCSVLDTECEALFMDIVHMHPSWRSTIGNLPWIQQRHVTFLPDVPADDRIRILVVGMVSVGKSTLIASLGYHGAPYKRLRTCWERESDGMRFIEVEGAAPTNAAYCKSIKGVMFVVHDNGLKLAEDWCRIVESYEQRNNLRVAKVLVVVPRPNCTVSSSLTLGVHDALAHVRRYFVRLNDRSVEDAVRFLKHDIATHASN